MKTPEDIAHELRGTCKHLSAILEENDMDGADNDLEFCRRLDAVVFCCESCEWWCEVDEMAEEGDSHGVCFDCSEGE